MAIYRLNHAVLYARSAEVSAQFYADVLGFKIATQVPGAVFMQAAGSTNDHDLGLFSVGSSAAASPAGRGGAVGLYHLAWEVDTLEDLAGIADALRHANALVGATDHGTTKALYGKDIDGIEFEVSWLVPVDRLTDELVSSKMELNPLDLGAEIDRYGADLRSGVGVSRPE